MRCLREAGAGGSNPLTPTNYFNELGKLSAGTILTEVHRKSIAFDVVPVTDPTWPIFCWANADLTLLVIPQDILRSQIAARLACCLANASTKSPRKTRDNFRTARVYDFCENFRLSLGAPGAKDSGPRPSPFEHTSCVPLASLTTPMAFLRPTGGICGC